MDRRRFLALLGPFGGVAAAGCLGRDSGPSTADGPAGTDSRASSEDVEPLAGGDRDGVYGRATPKHHDLAAWLRSPDDLDTILHVFDDGYRDAVASYVERTDFDTAGVAAYVTLLPSPSYEPSVDSATVRDDRVVVTTSAERDRSAGANGDAQVPVGVLKRVSAADPPPLLVVVGDESADPVSNRYEIRLERLSEDELDDRLDVAPVSAVPNDARSPIRSAIEDGETELETVPESLARTVAGHASVRDGSDYYELTAELPEYVLTAEIHDADDVDVDPDSDAVRDLRDLRDESETAADMVTTAMGGDAARRVALPPALETTLEAYDYVRRQPTVVELDVAVDDPGPPYAIRATPVSRAAALAALGDDDSPITIDDLPDSARTEVEAALEGSHEVYNPPALLKDDRHRSPIVVDGEVYRPTIEDAVGGNGF